MKVKLLQQGRRYRLIIDIPLLPKPKPNDRTATITIATTGGPKITQNCYWDNKPVRLNLTAFVDADLPDHLLPEDIITPEESRRNELERSYQFTFGDKVKFTLPSDTGTRTGTVVKVTEAHDGMVMLNVAEGELYCIRPSSAKKLKPAG